MVLKTQNMALVSYMLHGHLIQSSLFIACQVPEDIKLGIFQPTSYQ